MAKARTRPGDDELPSDASAGAGGGEPEQGKAYSPDRVAARAYELYLARGGSDGQDFDDWLAAERELASGPPEGDRDE